MPPTPLIPRAVLCIALGLALCGGPPSSSARAESAHEDRSGAKREGDAISVAAAVTYSRSEQALFARAEAGTLGSSDLFASALVASGVDEPQEQRFYEARLRHLTERLQGRIREAGDGAQGATARAALVHAFLHEVVLTGAYDLSCSRVSQAMDAGRYNCVSATILFNVLAATAGLETSGGESPAHVVSLVRTSEGTLHVETTCPRWFELRGAASSGPTLKAAQTSTRPTGREYRRLGTAELTALVYYNLGVDCAEQRRYAEALAANTKALRLDGSSTSARANLLAAINNWALELAQTEQFPQAVALLAQGREIAPEHPTFPANDVVVRERWVRWLCQRGQWSQADAVLQQADDAYPGQAAFAGVKRQLAEERAWHGESAP